ncbi:zinc ribbon domain-containing protein [Methanosphaera sp.]
MRKCSKCGADNPEFINICTNCGEDLGYDNRHYPREDKTSGKVEETKKQKTKKIDAETLEKQIQQQTTYDYDDYEKTDSKFTLENFRKLIIVAIIVIVVLLAASYIPAQMSEQERTSFINMETDTLLNQSNTTSTVLRNADSGNLTSEDISQIKDSYESVYLNLSEYKNSTNNETREGFLDLQLELNGHLRNAVNYVEAMYADSSDTDSQKAYVNEMEAANDVVTKINDYFESHEDIKNEFIDNDLYKYF